VIFAIYFIKLLLIHVHHHFLEVFTNVVDSCAREFDTQNFDLKILFDDGDVT